VVSEKSYSVNVYNKGAWALRMLSTLLGEKRFFDGTAYYAKKHAFGNVSTDDFRIAMEESSGERLDWFFDQWLYRSGYPALRVESDWDEGDNVFTMTITQVQKTDSLTGLFRFPMEIELTTQSEKTSRRVWIAGKQQTFQFSLDGKPLMVIVDKGLNVLKSIDFPKSGEEYLYQLNHADDVPDRLDALAGLEAVSGDSNVFRAVSAAATGDPFYEMRIRATTMIGGLGTNEAKNVLMHVYADTSGRVREAAIKALGNYKGDDVAEFLRAAALKDSSYLVLSACLGALAKVDSGMAFELATRSVNHSSYRDMIRRSSLQALRTIRDPRGLEAGIRCSGPDIMSFTRFSAIGLMKEIGKDSVSAQTTMRRLAADREPDIRSAAARALGEWGGEENVTFLEKRKEIEEDREVITAINEALSHLTK
jgi:aminopeptidase N